MKVIVITKAKEEYITENVMTTLYADGKTQAILKYDEKDISLQPQFRRMENLTGSIHTEGCGGDYGGGTENLVINEKILDTGKPTNGLKMQDSERECISDADKQDGNGGGTTYRCF